MKHYFFDLNGHWRNGWKALAYCVAAAAAVVGTSVASKAMPDGFSHYVPGPLLAFLSLLGAAWIFLRREGVPLASLGLRVNGAFLRQFGAGLGAGAALLALVAGAVYLSDGYHLERRPGAGALVLLERAWLFLAIALFEEALFRGYAFQRAIRGMGPGAAQLLFAVLFCLVHLNNDGMGGPTMALALLNIFLASLMLGYCYLRSGSLALPIGVHMGWNWAQSSLGFAGSGNASKGYWTPVYHDQASWISGGAFGLEASLAGVVVLALAVAALALWQRGKGGAAPRAGLDMMDNAQTAA